MWLYCSHSLLVLRHGSVHLAARFPFGSWRSLRVFLCDMTCAYSLAYCFAMFVPVRLGGSTSFGFSGVHKAVDVNCSACAVSNLQGPCEPDDGRGVFLPGEA